MYPAAGSLDYQPQCIQIWQQSCIFPFLIHHSDRSFVRLAAACTQLKKYALVGRQLQISIPLPHMLTYESCGAALRSQTAQTVRLSSCYAEVKP